MKIYIHHCNLKFEKTLVDLIKDVHELYGSLAPGDQELDTMMEHVSLVDNNNEAIKQALLQCDAIVYRLRKNSLDDAKYAIKVLEGADYQKEKRFVLISNTMTWSMTRKNFTSDDEEDDEEEDSSMNGVGDGDSSFKYQEYEEFTEDISVTRKPHPKFTMFMEVEKRLLRVENKTFRPFLLFSGTMYGQGEENLHLWFKKAWMGDDSIPCFGHGENYVPMIHFFDCAQIVQHLLQMPPDDDMPKYIFAVDDGMSKHKDVVAAIQKEFSVETVEKVDGDQLLLYDHADEFTNDVKIKIGIAEEFDIEWKYKNGLVKNIRKIRKEYEKERNLSPLKMCVVGPPASGKTSIASELSKHYKLVHVTIDKAIEEYFAQEAVIRDELERHMQQKEEAKKERLRQLQQAREELRKKMRENNENDEEDYDEENDDDAEQEDDGEDDQDKEENDGVARKLQRRLKQIATVYEMRDQKRPWRLNDKAVAIILQWKLEQRELKNKGWILDGFPKSINGCKELLQKIKIIKREGEEDDQDEEEDNDPEDSEEDEDEEHDEGGISLPRAHHLYFPEYIIALHATDDEILERRLMELQPSQEEKDRLQKELELCEQFRSQAQDTKKIKSKKDVVPLEQPLLHSSQDNFQRRLTEYKENFTNMSNIQQSETLKEAGDDNDGDGSDDEEEEKPKLDKSGVLAFLEEVRIVEKYQRPKFALIKDIVIKDNQQEIRSFVDEIVHFVGHPHNYGPTMEEIQELERQEAERRKTQKEIEEQELQDREEQERRERAARQKLLDEHEKRINDIKEQERQMLEVKSEPMRRYLMKNVIPILTKGLIEVCQVQPDDPVDYLAEWLFRYNMQETSQTP